MSFFAAAAAALEDDDGPTRSSPVGKLASDAPARASVSRNRHSMMLKARSTQVLTKIGAHTLVAGTPHEVCGAVAELRQTACRGQARPPAGCGFSGLVYTRASAPKIC